MNIFKYYNGLPKSVYIIFFAQIINRFGDFVLPFLVLFLVRKIGLSYQEAGIAAMTATLSTIPGSFAGGKIADHIGRKLTYGIFQSAAGFALLMCVFFDSAGTIITLICISSFLNGGVKPIFSAIIADVLPSNLRQKGYSLSYLGINIGVALGPIVAGFLFNNYLQLIFIGDALTSFLAVALVMRHIGESLPDKDSDQSDNINERREDGNLIKVLIKRPQILAFMFLNIFVSAAYNQHVFGLPIILNDIFGDSGPEYYGFVMSFNALTVLIMTVFVTRVTQRWNPLSSMTLTGIFYAVGFGMIGLINNMQMFIISTFIWTIGEILIVTNSGVFLANYAPQNFRARFNAVMSLSWYVGSFLGTAIMGMLMDFMGVRHVWAIVFLFGIISALGMHFLKFKISSGVDT